MEVRGPRRRGRIRLSANAQVRQEMQAFLKALESYPERVARDPELTFEQHHISLMRPLRAYRARRSRAHKNLRF